MRAASLLTDLLQLKQTRVRSVFFDEEGLVADVVPTTRVPRCAACGSKVRRVKDRRERRWRHLDLAGMRLHLRYSLRRVKCRLCGVTVEWVPWADHTAWFTRPFEQLVGWLTQRCDRTSVSKLMRLGWKTVGRIVSRVAARLAPGDRLDP